MIISKAKILSCFAVIFITLLNTCIANCDKIHLDKVLIDEGDILVEFSVENFIDSSLATILDENFRINFVIDVSLVTAGRKILNKPVASETIVMFLEHDLWLRRYLLEKEGSGKREIYATIEHLDRRISSTYSVRLPGLENLKNRDSYYILLSITIKPVTTGTFREIMGWFVAGDSLDKKKTGIDSGVARIMLGVFKRAFNLEDIRYREKSESFTLSDLQAR